MTVEIQTSQPAFSRIVGEPGSDLHGFVVIDRFVAGRGTGGIRCSESVSLDEVARLAREMTLKFAFLRLPSGGAKAGLVAPRDIPADARQQLFRRFGDAIGDLIREGKYVGGLDLGTGVRDLDALRAGAGVPAEPGDFRPDIDSNYFTALTVFVALQAMLAERQRDLFGASVILEGVGKVGSHLLRLLGDTGATVVGVSTLCGAIYNGDGLDVDGVLDASASRGDDFVRDFPDCERLPSTELFQQPADVLIPGGGADSIDARNIDGIKARWVVPIANICATPEIEQEMFQRDIEFVPGFVSNSGGVFCWHLGRLSASAREEIIRDRFRARISRLIRTADRSGQSISETARNIASRNLRAMQAIDEGLFGARLVAMGRKLSPRRLGHVIGARLFRGSWGRTPNFFIRSYYDARYFS